MAYIPHWRGEAKVVVAASKLSDVRVACVCLFLKAMAGNSSTNLESVTNRITNKMVLHLNHTLPAFKLTLASLCVVDTFLKLNNQILVVT
jgi:hypothetical protein